MLYVLIFRFWSSAALGPLTLAFSLTVSPVVHAQADASILPPQISQWASDASPADTVTIKGSSMVFALEGGYDLAYVGPYSGKIQDTSRQSGQAEVFKITGEISKPLPNAGLGFEPYIIVVLVPGIDTSLNKKTITFMFFSSALQSGGTPNSSDEGPDISTTYEEP